MWQKLMGMCLIFVSWEGFSVVLDGRLTCGKPGALSLLLSPSVGYNTEWHWTAKLELGNPDDKRKHQP